jgi:hypothetical protein
VHKCRPSRYTDNVYFRRGAVADHHGLEQEFENALKDVVSSKRASVSKMNRLSEAAKRCFEVCFASSTAISKRNQFQLPPLPFCLSCLPNRLLTF